MNPKILIVDDHSDIRRLIRITLGKNYEILEAEDGPTALEVATRQRPDLMVLDVMMPGTMDGLQVLDAVKRDPDLNKIRVVMVTARGQTRDYDDGMARGADAYFVKPFSPLQLVSAIRDILAGKAS